MTTTLHFDLDCIGYASPVTPGSTSLHVFAACSTAASATRVEFVFGTPVAPLGAFTAPSDATCEVTSSSSGTNDQYDCSGAFSFPLHGTKSFGTVEASAAPGSPSNAAFYLFQGSTKLGPFPVH